MNSSSSSFHTYNDSPSIEQNQHLRLIPPKTPLISLQILENTPILHPHSPLSPAKNSLTPLISAVLIGNFELVHTLLAYKNRTLSFAYNAYVFTDATALTLALFLHKRLIPELLSEAGPALSYKLKNETIKTFCCEMGGSGDEQFKAAQCNEMVIKAIDQTDFRGRTVFMAAILAGSLDTAIQFIFQAGRVDGDGKCALQLALDAKLWNMVEFCTAIDSEALLVPWAVVQGVGKQVLE